MVLTNLFFPNPIVKLFALPPEMFFNFFSEINFSIFNPPKYTDHFNKNII